MKYSQIRHTLLAIAAILVVVALFNWATGFRSPLLATVAAVVAIIVIFFEVRHYQTKEDREHPESHHARSHKR